MKKNKKNNKIIEEIMDTPKVSLALFGTGFLIFLFSVLTLRNPFFLVTGIFAAIVFFYWAYDYWYKKLNDLKVESLSKKIDSLIYPPK